MCIVHVHETATAERKSETEFLIRSSFMYIHFVVTDVMHS